MLDLGQAQTQQERRDRATLRPFAGVAERAARTRMLNADEESPEFHAARDEWLQHRSARADCQCRRGIEMPELFSGNPRKVIVSRDEVRLFNASWPCSELRTTRHYWFEFDARGDLVDSDVPEQDDGSAAAAMADDCRAFLMDDKRAGWMI